MKAEPKQVEKVERAGMYQVCPVCKLLTDPGQRLTGQY